MTPSVAIGGEETERFQVEVGVKQGCVLAPVIFNLYRLDGSVFDLCRLQARTRVNYEEVNELQYADDCALIAEDPESLQHPLNCLAEVYTAMVLVFNSDKTKVIL